MRKSLEICSQKMKLTLKNFFDNKPNINWRDINSKTMKIRHEK